MCKIVSSFFLVMAILLCSAMPAVGASSIDLVRLVERAYRDYAWVAIFGVVVESDMKPLASEQVSVLRQYFTSDLVKAISEDQKLAESSGGVGSIDFDILFDSQDPSASDLTIEADGPYVVLACFKQLGRKKCVTFIGSFELGSMKIRDIRYENGLSLRKLLKLS
jgi:hypothetical protein